MNKTMNVGNAKTVKERKRMKKKKGWKVGKREIRILREEMGKKGNKI